MPGLTTAFAQGLAANRPAAAASNAGFMWFSTDTGILAQSTGSAWTTIGPAVALDALTTKGDLLTRTASGYARLGVGSNNQVLTADSTQTSGLKWAAAGASSVTTKGDLQGYDVAATRIPVGTDGQILTADSTQALGVKWAASGASGGLVKLDEVGPLGTAQAALDFPSSGGSISGSYRSLQIVLHAASSANASNTTLLMQVNADSGANYDREEVASNGASAPTGAQDFAQTSAQIAYLAARGTGVVANNASAVDILIPQYAGTTFAKGWRVLSTLNALNSSGNTFITMISAFWRSTAAITSIHLFCGSGSFVAGSVATLYGLA